MDQRHPALEEIAKRERELRALVEYAWECVPFYRRHWQQAGFSPERLRRPEDFLRIPTFSMDEVRESIRRKPPWGEHQATGAERNAIIFSSGGTTGLPRPYLVSRDEWGRIKMCWAQVLSKAGVSCYDVVQVSFGLSTLIAGPGSAGGALSLGATVLPTGTGQATPTRLQLEMARAWGTTVWIGSPNFALHLGDLARELGWGPEQFKLRMFVTAGEPLASVTRQRIDQFWGARTIDVLGCVEAGPATGGECSEGSGIHILEDSFLYECIEPDAGELCPPGEAGALVLTNLWRRSCPLIRYNTKDVSAIHYAPCPMCGTPGARIASPLQGRLDERIKVRGVYLFPPAIGEIIRAEPACNADYLITLKDEPRADSLFVDVELGDEHEEARAVADRLERKIKEEAGISVTINVLGSGEVRTRIMGLGGFKARHILDLREGFSSTPGARPDSKASGDAGS